MIWIAKAALWLAESKVGRFVAMAVGLLITIGLAVLKVFNAGKASERGRQDRQSLENFRERARIENEVDSLPPNDVKRRLSRWVRPPGGR